jgi:hypothetical protein
MEGQSGPGENSGGQGWMVVAALVILVGLVVVLSQLDKPVFPNLFKGLLGS